MWQLNWFDGSGCERISNFGTKEAAEKELDLLEQRGITDVEVHYFERVGKYGYAKRGVRTDIG